MIVHEERQAVSERPLRGILAEFRTALREEIEAAKRSAANNAVPLVNGHRIGQIASSYQYVFEIENVLTLPGDAPGDLIVAGQPPLDVIVVSVEGLSITLSVGTDLGKFVPEAKLQSNLAHLMRRLIERIENLADADNAVGERIRGARPVSGEALSHESIDVRFAAATPNRDQLSAITSALGRNVTFIWGPPGTGKSHTIGMIGAELFRRDRSVLLVSHTNNAVDQAIWHVARIVGDQALSAGRVLRVGEPKDERIAQWQDLLLSTHVERRSQELVSRRALLQENLSSAMADVEHVNRELEICQWVAEAQGDLEEMDQSLAGIQDLEEELAWFREKRRQLLDEKPQWEKAKSEAERARGCLCKAATVGQRCSALRAHIEKLEAGLLESVRLVKDAEAVLAETTSVGALRRWWRQLPAPQEQAKVVQRYRRKREEIVRRLSGEQQNLQDAEEEGRGLLNRLAAFRRQFQAEPDALIERANEAFEELASTERRITEVSRDYGARRQSLEALVFARLDALCEWGLAQRVERVADTALEEIHKAFERTQAAAAELNLDEVRSRRDALNDEIRQIEAQLASIENALKEVEKVVIANATVVATTLTRAYLRDAIQSRRFDTVILDEASMAPIPALWVAASIATANAVVVGDFKQLPPIVLSKHALAKRWLGRDVFQEAQLSPVPSPPPSHLVTLRRQYRMHPAISAIPNTLIYDSLLEDEPCTTCDESLGDWYNAAWGHDAPVLLVDMGPVHAWVTSVRRGDRSSRLNFLSAAVCVDLAQRLLKEPRKPTSPGSEKRILIVCPYRPHAQLLELLLREEGLTDDVGAGTTHSFQGSEADAVILDLVNDEPHWRVGMFRPDRDDATRRLLNVALTRARRRLIIVGDFDYISALGKKAFLGRDLVPFVTARYKRVNALNVVPEGLAARAARAQENLLGGNVAPPQRRIVVTQKQFYSILRGDVERARRRIVIFSAFITGERLSQLEPSLRAALERGLRVYVVTRAHFDRGRRELAQYRLLERSLEEWGVVVIHKRRMHEKLVFIDDSILWSGSLNPLSFRDTQEVMERRFSEAVVSDFARTLRLGELVGAYEGKPPTCPYCGDRVIASEGRDDPFYWRCIHDGCYTRSIDEPPIEGGVIVCRTCGAGVRFGEWGGKPAWRCVKNRRHHRKVMRTHLRLPNMRRMIPKQTLRQLDREFGLERHAATRPKKEPQGRLFSECGDLDI